MRKVIVLCLLLIAGGAYGFTGQEHTSDQLTRIWGFKRETLLEVNRIIDTVPGRETVGGFMHRQAWGHSDEWFSRNWETVAAPFKAECPTLTRAELKALAQNAWDVHINGDSTTRAGIAEVDLEALRTRLRGYPPELAGANNKTALLKAGTSANFTAQPANIERLQAQHLITANTGCSLRVLGRNNTVIIAPDGQEYVIAMKRSVNDLKAVMQRFPERKFALTPEDFAALSEREPELARRAVTFGQLGDARTKSEILDDAARLCEARRSEFAAHQERITAEAGTSARRAMAKSALKTFAPYALFGGITALAENWTFIKDAYDNKADWSRVLSRTGIDFAGYTVTPMVIDGVLAAAGKKVALAASLKGAGMGYTLGYFCWNAGKEYFSYSVGDISREEFARRMKAHAARGVEILPVNVLAYLVSGTGYTILVPAVIIAGGFAIQRVHAWYEAKRWRDCVYLDDVRAVLGEDMINAFTLAAPETRASLADPETRTSLANPERRSSLANP